MSAKGLWQIKPYIKKKLMFWYSGFHEDYVLCLPEGTFSYIIPEFKLRFYSISFKVNDDFEKELQKTVCEWMQ